MAKPSKSLGFEAIKGIAKPMGVKNPGAALAAVSKAVKAAGKPKRVKR